MDIIENISVTLTEKEIQELIEKELRSKGYTIEGKISINLTTQYSGQGSNETSEKVFSNITCKASKTKRNENSFERR